MAASNLVLIPGGGGVGRAVFEHLRARDVPVRFMVRREDERAAELNRLGAEVVIGDLTRPETVAAALQGVARMFFAMAVSPDHLLAATVVASVAKEYGKLEALVDLSQMTVSQMTATSTEESHQQRLHWLAEQVLNWSGLPVVHIRPTVFLDTPLFTTMAARSIQEDGTIALSFGTGRTSPVAVDDVARVVAAGLRDPAPHIGHVYELTGPHSVDIGHWTIQRPREGRGQLRHVGSVAGRALQHGPAAAHRTARRHHGPAAPRQPLRPHSRRRRARDRHPAPLIEAFVAARRAFYLGGVRGGGSGRAG